MHRAERAREPFVVAMGFLVPNQDICSARREERPRTTLVAGTFYGVLGSVEMTGQSAAAVRGPSGGPRRSGVAGEVRVAGGGACRADQAWEPFAVVVGFFESILRAWSARLGLRKPSTRASPLPLRLASHLLK